nr:SusC/RagA family TonB-linked outer membrane protein [uncultured Draconibacterium sp.]
MKKKFRNAFLHDRRVQKVLLTMKLTTLFLLLSLMQVSATVYSQATKFNFRAENKQIADVLKEIEESSDFRFFYIREQVDVERQVSLSTNNSTVEEILDEIFQNQGIIYQVMDDNAILLRPNTNYSHSQSEAQQQKSVSGKVTDSSGLPLPGVTIALKGTTNGTVSDIDGEFLLNNIPENATLVFSFVGMKSQEISVEGTTSLNVVMQEDAIGVEEVVVVGYGTQKKVNLTGAVGAISSEELAERPVQNASQILQGLVPGLNISQSQGGSLDSDPEINIRGIATIGEGSTGSPLILIDGMEGDINALNPQDIENVSVLKDAAASSIYGSRAPFGVILITTKQGKKGQVVVNYNNSLRWNYPINMPDMMDSYTFGIYYNEAYINAGQAGYFSEERLQRIKDYQDGVIDYVTIPDPRNTAIWGNGWRVGNDNIDWYDTYYKKYAFSQEHNISSSGGNEKLQFYFSGNYLDQGGLMNFGEDDFNRYSTTVKIRGQLNDWFSIDVANRFIREDYERPAYMTNTFYMDLARGSWPTISLYDPNGYLMNTQVINLQDGGKDGVQRDWLYQQIKFNLEPVKDWKTHIDFNYRTRNEFRHYDTQKTYAHNVAEQPYYVNSTTQVYEYAMRQNFLTTNIFTEYEKHFDNGHYLKGLVGFQAEDSGYRNLSAKRNGIIVASLPVINLTSGTDLNGNTVSPVVTGYTDSWSTSGFFGRVNYNYKEKYLLEVNLRYDGTSRYREDMRWQWFPSVSTGWNIAREEFWEPIQDKISNLKLRVSYGELGNQNTSSIYPTYLTMTTGTANGGWLVNGAKPNTAQAPGLISQSMTWEKINSWNIGTDIGMFKNKLNASFDYFTRKTLDMVGPAPELPVILGTDVPKANNTDLKTYGFELSLSWKDHLENGLGYSVNFMLSDSQTEITRYPNETNNLDTYRSGMKMGEIWGYETVGIAKSQEEMDAHLGALTEGGQNAIGSNWAAGDIMYKDLNGDKKIDNGSYTLDDHGDLKIIGNNTPRYQFALDLSANWKGFDVRALFQGVMKRDYFQNSYYFWGASSRGLWWSAGFEDHKDFFRNEDSYTYAAMGENLDSYYPRPIFSSKNQQVQSRYLQDASYIRLKNLQIGYTVPQALSEKIKMKQLRIFVSGENLWTGTKMTKMFDPETVGAGTGSNAVGWGGNTYPLSKVFSAGVNVNF